MVSPMGRVLVADDDPLMRTILQSYLAGTKGARVTTVENGNEALAVLSDPNQNVELILSDLNMPQMDGVQFLRHLKELNYTGRLAIISGEDTSVLSVARDLASAYNLDLLGTLPKPINKQKLEQLVETAASDGRRIHIQS